MDMRDIPLIIAFCKALAPKDGGAPGVGIASVAQTTTSTEDGGVNVITVTMTDGSSSTFEVRNGTGTLFGLRVINNALTIDTSPSGKPNASMDGDTLSFNF